MDRLMRKKTLWWLGGALLAGTAALALRRALDVDLDLDPWDELFPA